MRFIYLVSLCLFAIGMEAQESDFYREELRFSVDSQWFTMQGDFFLARSSASVTTLRLGFPVPEGTMGLIDTFSVYDYQSQRYLPAVRGRSEFNFSAPFGKKDSIVLHISYRQRIADTVLCYIITTVQAWGRPLRYAAYSLEVPEYAQVSGFSLADPYIVRSGSSKVYMWERHNFMPRDDIKFNYYIKE